MATQTDIRVLVPRIRRAVEGPMPQGALLSDDTLKDIVADALADVILYSGSVFGKTLIVTVVDDATGAATEYATSDELTLMEQAVIAAQAALNFFFFKFVGLKTSERIADEAGAWEWATSSNLLRDAFKSLTTQRDKAIEALGRSQNLDSYTSFLVIRDREVSRAIEPWVDGSGAGGLELSDLRFG